MKKLGNVFVATFVTTCILLSFSCSGRYGQSGPVTSASEYPSMIEHAKKDKRYLIMHSGVNIYSITAIEIDKAKQKFTVQLDKLDSLHSGNINAVDTISRRFTPLHLYMADSTSYTLDEPHTILLEKIGRIESVK